MKFSKTLMAAAILTSGTNAFAAYTCNVSLYDGSKPLASQKALASSAIQGPDHVSSFGSLVDEYYKEAKRSYLSLSGMLVSWPERKNERRSYTSSDGITVTFPKENKNEVTDHAEIYFNRHITNKKGFSIKTDTIGKVTLSGNETKIATIDKYLAIVSCIRND